MLHTGAIPKADYRRRNTHAELYYKEIRARSNDIKAIAKNTGMSIEKIRNIKNHIFINKYDLGESELTRFDADYNMAISWQRLIEGTNIQKMDIILLKHELLEFDLMKCKNLTYTQAHKLAEREYNYSELVNLLDK